MCSFLWRSSFGFGRLQIACPTRPRAIILIFLLCSFKAFLTLDERTENEPSRRLNAWFASAWKKTAICFSRISESKKCSSLRSSKKVASGFSFVGQNAYELLKDVIVEKTLIVTIDQKSCTRLLICGSESICGTVLGVVCMHVSFSFPRSTSDNCCSSIVSSRNQFKSYSNWLCC